MQTKSGVKHLRCWKENIEFYIQWKYFAKVDKDKWSATRPAWKKWKILQKGVKMSQIQL